MSGRRFLATIPSVISGRQVLSSTKIPVFSHKAEVLHHYLPLPDNLTIDEICEDAYEGFLQWSTRTYKERSEILYTAADSIARDRESFIAAHVEIGGSPTFATICADNAADDIREYARITSRAEGTVSQSVTSKLALTLRTPLGPVLSIAPWNAPTVLWSRAITAPLAAGCSVIMKSSEKAPKLPFMYTEHLLKAGVDAKALQLVNVAPGDHATVTQSFLAHDLVRKVNFTGSTAVGTKIAETAAKYLKPTLLELGGKNISIICEDADIERAAFNLVLSGWMHKGQVCMCVDNVYIHEAVYDKFITSLVSVARDFAASPEMSIEQRDAAGAKKVDRLVSDALGNGATIIYGEQLNGTSTNYPPLILGDVTPEMNIESEETFGPVFSVFKYGDVEEVLAKLNRSKYGLKASIWSGNVLGAISLAKRMDFGGIHINGSTVHDEATIPHGGVKLSGTGRFNSIWGVDEFTYTKSITLDQ